MPTQPLISLRVRAARIVLPLVEDCRAALGIRRGVHAGGVYYKELSPERLQRALSKRGPGFKDYRVTFPDGVKQIIRCAPMRCYADLMGPEGLHRLTAHHALIRPGMRVLEITGPPFATGYTSAYLAGMVGASGAVVSILGDEQGARFGARRYAGPNLSIEPSPPEPDGPLGSLIGEVDGAFDAVVCLHPPVIPARLTDLIRGVWRVVRPGGWVLLGVPRGHAGALDQATTMLSSECRAQVSLISQGESSEGWEGHDDGSDAVVRKPV